MTIAFLDEVAVLLIDALVKCAALLLAARGVTLIMRRRSAAARDMVWRLAIVAVLVAPLLSAALPGWRITLRTGAAPDNAELASAASADDASNAHAPPIAAAVASESFAIETSPPIEEDIIADVASNSPADARLAEESTAAAVISPAPEPVATAPAATASTAPVAAPPSSAATNAEPAATPVNWLAWFAAIWAIGAAVLLARLMLAVVLVLGVVRRATTITDADWRRVCDEARAALGVRSRVRLLASADASVPMAWQPLPFIRATVLLPATALNDDGAWPAERRRVVLMHELAHIRRSDGVMQILARLTAALYWPNPLAWLAARSLQRERERACDDAVLAAGHKASDYAQHLLAIATQTARPNSLAIAAAAMARPNELEGRLLAVLDEHRNRNQLTRAGAALAILFIAAITVPLAMVRATQEVEEPVNDAVNGAAQPIVNDADSGTQTSEITEYVQVKGDVQRPGNFIIPKAEWALVQILMGAGIDWQREATSIVIMRANPDERIPNRLEIPLSKVLDTNPELANGDIVRVIVPDAPEKADADKRVHTPSVHVIGEVPNPGSFVVSEGGLALRELLVAAGVSAQTILDDKIVELVRQNDGELMRHSIAISSLFNGEVDDISLRPNDIVRVKAIGRLTNEEPAPEPTRGEGTGDPILIMEAFKTEFTGAYTALVENDDPEAARKILDAMKPRVDTWRAQLKGTDVEPLLGGMLGIFDDVRRALAEGNAGQAKVLMTALSKTGPSLEKTLRQSVAERANRNLEQAIIGEWKLRPGQGEPIGSLTIYEGGSLVAVFEDHGETLRKSVTFRIDGNTLFYRENPGEAEDTYAVAVHGDVLTLDGLIFDRVKSELERKIIGTWKVRPTRETGDVRSFTFYGDGMATGVQANEDGSNRREDVVRYQIADGNVTITYPHGDESTFTTDVRGDVLTMTGPSVSFVADRVMGEHEQRLLGTWKQRGVAAGEVSITFSADTTLVRKVIGTEGVTTQHEAWEYDGRTLTLFRADGGRDAFDATLRDDTLVLKGIDKVLIFDRVKEE